MFAARVAVPLALVAAFCLWIAGGVADVTGAGLAQPESLVAPGATLQKLATGYQFTEGPAVYHDGSLFFSDVQASEAFRLGPEGGVERHRRFTGRGNGLYFDSEWRLVTCEMQSRRLSIDDMAGTVTTVVDNYRGAQFNAPNDLWIHPDGGIYFTDPDFAGSGLASHVFYVPPQSDEAEQVIDDIVLPNGVIGTPDGETLFVTDYSGTATWKYPILDDGALGQREKFSAVGGDGMTLDESGNLYLAAQDVLIFSSDGTQIETIEVPETVSNLTFGGPDGKTLYITAVTSVYSIEMVVRGAFAPELQPPATSVPTATPATPAPTATPPAPTATATADMVPPSATPTQVTPPPLEDWWLYLPVAYAD